MPTPLRWTKHVVSWGSGGQTDSTPLTPNLPTTSTLELDTTNLSKREITHINNRISAMMPTPLRWTKHVVSWGSGGQTDSTPLTPNLPTTSTLELDTTNLSKREITHINNRISAMMPTPLRWTKHVVSWGSGGQTDSTPLTPNLPTTSTLELDTTNLSKREITHINNRILTMMPAPLRWT